VQGYAWFFLGYEATVQAFLQAGHGHTKEDLNYLQVMTAGVAAGFGLWGSMFPIDTIKSKMQADSLVRPTYTTTMDCLRQTMKQEGSAGMWRGFSAAMYRAIPVNASIFLAVEGTRQGIAWAEEKGMMTKLMPATA
jgi:solute carrier family 25 carnitine/acylcarnitine transporter 20/29